MAKKHAQMSDRVEAALDRAFKKLKAMDSSTFKAKINQCQPGGIADLLDNGRYMYAQNTEFEAYKSSEYTCSSEQVVTVSDEYLINIVVPADPSSVIFYGSIGDFSNFIPTGFYTDDDDKIAVESNDKAKAA